MVKFCKRCIEEFDGGQSARFCPPCRKLNKKEYDALPCNRARARKASQAYRLRYPERVRDNRRRNQRKVTLKNKFGLTVEQYADMLVAQDSACAICKSKPEGTDVYRKGKHLAVDHCHSTGIIRGLLCDLCNRAMGQFHDNPKLLRKAAEYIENPPKIAVKCRGYKLTKRHGKR